MALNNQYSCNSDRFRLLCVFMLMTVTCGSILLAQENKSYITAQKVPASFTLSSSGKTAPIYVSSQDYPGVLRVAKHLQADLKRVTSAEPALITDVAPAAGEVVLVGTIGKNPLIDKLIEQRRLDAAGIAGRWEVFLIQVVEQPLPGVDRALVIAGSDKRGTIYGMYDLSAQIGVSPWYWWADVPAKKQSSLFVLSGRHTQGEPAVKYRGIFINDEAPALTGWAFEKFGGFNHRFYEHVFELILRMKGNFLWPAMWGRAFYDDDPENPRLADEYGVVIGTSHHEPMMRAHDEWRRYGNGPWNYQTNADTLKQFWKEGIRRTGSHESIVTLAMRGDGDEPMSAQANISLLERIVNDQREILGEVTGKDVTTIPQVWALYKEVQEYYDKGMRVPDDVTLLLCDDNWGNIRKLPNLNDPPRKGGYGIYYHYDFVGGPRNYKWLNTNQISRVWEQMHLAYEYGARQIWIVNVGDIKPMELPIQFFLDYAWSPNRLPAERLPEYTLLWSEQQFGPEFAQETADILTTYTMYNSRRKPELLSPETYSLTDYREAETVVSEYNDLAEKAQWVYNALTPEYKDAFYQLVLHPVVACANLNMLYRTVGKNRLYAQQGRSATNSLASKARELFNNDTTITHYYNRVLAGGKWSHMMDQTHIGYTYWQQPDSNRMPEVKWIDTPDGAEMGVAIEGSTSWWPNEKNDAVLPEFDVYSQQRYYIELFNLGRTPFEYSVQTGKPWVQVNPSKGTVGTEERLWVNVDWKVAPAGTQRIPITVTGPNKSTVVVQAVVKNPVSPKREELVGFVESQGYVSMEAEHYSRTVETSSIKWQRVSDLGRTLSAITPFPVTAPALPPGGDGARLDYRVHFFSSGTFTVYAYLSPTLNFYSDSLGRVRGLRYAVSFDNEQPQVVNIHQGDTIPDWKYPQWWNQAVSNNIRITTSRHTIANPGEHVLKFWAVDPGVVLQKIVVETGNMKPSYLGPPESFRGGTASMILK